MTGSQESIKSHWVRWFNHISSSTEMEDFSGRITSPRSHHEQVAPTSSSIQQIVDGNYVGSPTDYDLKLIIFKNQESHATAFLETEHPTIPQQQIQKQRQGGRIQGKEGQRSQSRTRNRHRYRRRCFHQPRCCRNAMQSKVRGSRRWSSSMILRLTGFADHQHSST